MKAVIERRADLDGGSVGTPGHSGTFTVRRYVCPNCGSVLESTIEDMSNYEHLVLEDRSVVWITKCPVCRFKFGYKGL